MRPEIHEQCGNCGNMINIERERFWLRHGRNITRAEREAFGMLCDNCIYVHIIKGLKNEINAIRKRSLTINK